MLASIPHLSSMAPSFKSFLFSSLLLLLLSSAAARRHHPRPRPLILLISKDAATLQYLTSVSQRTPLIRIQLVLNLGGRFLWVKCNLYSSSTYRPILCGNNNPECLRADPDECTDGCDPVPFPTPTPGAPAPAPPPPASIPGCTPEACGVSSDNNIPSLPFPMGATSELGEDVLSLPCNRTIAHFYFQCAPSFLLQGLANGTSGMAGLGRSAIALPAQLSAAFGFPSSFSLCLSPSSNGALLFNSSTSLPLTYTPLLVNPVNREGSQKFGVPSAEYFIGVTSIRVKKRTVPLNTALLAIDSRGIGGTKISTINPYTTLETSIYKAVTGAFATAMGNVTRVAPVGPLELCYRAAEIRRARAGPAVPTIDLVMGSVHWKMYGANTMVRVEDRVLCLGFVDAGVLSIVTPVIIGGHQLEDNLLEFDLAASRLGFSGTLLRLRERTTCARVASKAMRYWHP